MHQGSFTVHPVPHIHNYYCLFLAGPHAPRSVTSFCTVIVWQAPTRVSGFITGYQLRFYSSEQFGSGTGQMVLITKGRDELFHAVSAEDLPPRGSGDTLVEV